MAFPQFEYKRIEALTDELLDKRRPPVELRDQVDIGFKIEKQSVIIFEIRPSWRNPDQKTERMLAKATFISSQKIWKIYWQRADLKWHSYEPLSKTDKFEDFLAAVDEDKFGCFWG